MSARGGGFTEEQNERLRSLARQWLAGGREQGRTQAKLGELLGVNKGRVSRFLKERGEGISPAVAVRLAQLTGYDISALLAGEKVRVPAGADLPGLEEQIARSRGHGVSQLACNGAARMARALGPTTVTPALFDRLVDIADRFGDQGSLELEIAGAVESPPGFELSRKVGK